MPRVQRSGSYMPPGTVTPFILRFDVGNVPVGFLGFSSATHSLGEIQDSGIYARKTSCFYYPGVSTPPPFGGNQRSIVITVNASKLSQYHLSIDDIVNAIGSGLLTPSGIVRTGNLQRMATINSVVRDIQELGDIPLTLARGLFICVILPESKIFRQTSQLVMLLFMDGVLFIWLFPSKPVLPHCL